MCSNKSAVEVVWIENFDLEVENILLQRLSAWRVHEEVSHLPIYLLVDISLCIWLSKRTCLDS